MAEDLTVRIGIEDDVTPALANISQAAGDAASALEDMGGGSGIDSMRDMVEDLTSSLQGLSDSVTSSASDAGNVISEMQGTLSATASDIENLRSMTDGIFDGFGSGNAAVEELASEMQSAVESTNEYAGASENAAQSDEAFVDMMLQRAEAADTVAGSSERIVSGMDNEMAAYAQVADASLELSNNTEASAQSLEALQQVVTSSADAFSVYEQSQTASMDGALEYQELLQNAQTALADYGQAIEQAAQANDVFANVDIASPVEQQIAAFEKLQDASAYLDTARERAVEAVTALAEAGQSMGDMGASAQSAASGVNELGASMSQADAFAASVVSAVQQAEQSVQTLGATMSEAESLNAALVSTVNDSTAALEGFASTGQESASASAELSAVIEQATEAAAGQVAAYEEATAATENYESVMASGATSVAELEAAAQRATEANENLSTANQAVADSMQAVNDTVSQLADVQIDTAMQNAASAITATETAYESLNATIEQTTQSILQSGEMTEAQDAAMQNAASTASETQAAIDNLRAAFQNLSSYLESGGQEMETLQQLQQQLSSATNEAASACENAAQATGQLNESMQQGSEATREGADAFQLLGDVLGAVGLSMTFSEITSSLYEFAEAFEEATATVMLATGATGDALEGLQTSMSNAFSNANNASLSDTATVIGEMNTRLGYTGEQLTTATNQMLDFSNATGVDMGGSVRLVTQLMNQWGVDASNMGSVLDELTIAGQASGISVEALSQQLTTNKGVLDGYGFSLEEAMALMMNFELTGTNVTRVMTGLNKALSSGAISSMEELYTVFEEISTGAMNASEATQLFGQRSATAIVQAVQSGAMNLDSFVSMLDTAQGTMKTAADASLTMGQKWEQATSRIKNAIGTSMQPVISTFMEGLTGAAEAVADFAEQHEAATAAITTGITVLAGGAAAWATFKAVSSAVAAVQERHAVAQAMLTVAQQAGATSTAAMTAAETASIPAAEGAAAATATFGAAIQSAFLPITLVTAAVAGIAVGVGTWIKSMDDANDSMNQLTPVCREQAEILHQHEEELKAYSESSDDAASASNGLAEQVELERAAFEATKQTVSEFKAELEGVIDTSNQTIQSINDLLSSADSAPTKAKQYGKTFADISKATEGTVGHTAAMTGSLKKIQETFPQVSVTAEDFAKDFDGSMAKMQEQMSATMNQDRLEDYMEAYSLASDQLNVIDEERQKVQENLDAAQADLDAQRAEGWGTNIDLETQIEQYGEALATLDEQASHLQEQQQAAQEGIRETSAAIQESEEAARKAADGFNGLFNALSGEGQSAMASLQIVDQIKPQLELLGQAFDEARDKASQSLQSMFDVWTKFKMPEDVLGINQLIKNVQKMNEVRDQWGANLDAIEQKLDQTALSTQEKAAVMAEAAKGPAEAASIAKGGIDELTQLGEQLSQLAAGNDDFSIKLGEIEVDASGLPDNVKQAMETALANSGLSEGLKEPLRTALSEAIDGLGAGDTSGFDNLGPTLASAIANSDMSDAGKAAATQIVDSMSAGIAANEGGGMQSFAQALGNNVTAAIGELTQFKDSGKTAAEQFGQGLSNASNLTTDAQAAVEKTAQAAKSSASKLEPAGQDCSKNLGQGIQNNKAPITSTQSVIDEVTRMCAAAQPVITITTKLDSSATAAIAGHARGTRDAENVFVAGEEGPELIVGAEHSVVYTASETERILKQGAEFANAMNGSTVGSVVDTYGAAYPALPSLDQLAGITSGARDTDPWSEDSSKALEKVRSEQSTEPEAQSGPSRSYSSEITHRIEINGSGEIRVDGLSEDDVMDMLIAQVGPIFRDMVKQEVFEEGQGAYAR